MPIYLAAIVIFLLDRLTKIAVMKYMLLGESIPLFPKIFHLTYIHNQGVAFGMLSSYSKVLTGVSLILIVTIIFFQKQLVGGDCWRRIALGLILGGAAGNFFDRLIYGSVIDFLDFRVWPVFNLADSAISIGIFFLIFKFNVKKI
ncbi:MAG: signal peptidase II [Elusimicrobiota bacterium]